MPWIFPDTADSYLALLNAIDRKAFAVHFDPVNLITSPKVYYQNGTMIKEFITKLGPYIKSCHAKDIKLNSKFTVHLDEVMPGMGGLDYPVFLRELNKLDREIPIILEHLTTKEEYKIAADFIRKIASRL